MFTVTLSAAEAQMVKEALADIYERCDEAELAMLKTIIAKINLALGVARTNS